jgi:hypothetical protein
MVYPERAEGLRSLDPATPNGGDKLAGSGRKCQAILQKP